VSQLAPEPGRAIVGNQAQETIGIAWRGVRRDEGAGTLPAFDDMCRSQFVQRAPHRARAGAEALRQMRLAGQGISGLPFASGQGADDELTDLFVERRSGPRRSLGHACIRARRGLRVSPYTPASSTVHQLHLRRLP